MSKTLIRAYGVAFAAFAIWLASYMNDKACQVSPCDDLDPYLLTSQQAALGGIILALQSRPGPQGPPLTLVIAPLALLIGAVAPWLYRTIPSSSLRWYHLAKILQIWVLVRLPSESVYL